MIEFKDVTTESTLSEKGLGHYSLIVRDGEVCMLPQEEAHKVIFALLGFLPAKDGYISYDGSVMTNHSASWLRQHTAYVPLPYGFDNHEDCKAWQLQMVREALDSDKHVLLLDNPFCEQDEETAAALMSEIRQRAAKGDIVIMTEYYDKQEILSAGGVGEPGSGAADMASQGY